MPRRCELISQPVILSSSLKNLALRTRYKRSPGMGDTSWVYRSNARIPRKMIFTQFLNLLSLRRHGIVRAATHQDEFPAEYSLAGCSPAEPASASSAVLILNQKPSVRQQFSANGNCSLGVVPHFAAQFKLNSSLVRTSSRTQSRRSQLNAKQNLALQIARLQR
jgi:hypothetical protein